ncbi:unnamed protein product [Nesidiocoris tenuis]|uniref:Uncharacterized protein n=1 Tax=Nesidiocoris tenuis TaxID=355587 RepID=A0A6H5GGL4_9HEMI|nr:unnamed protein product [Nesidiocoris tenuis]
MFDQDTLEVLLMVGHRGAGVAQIHPRQCPASAPRRLRSPELHHRRSTRGLMDHDAILDEYATERN